MSGMITLADWMFYVIGGVIVILGMICIALISMVYSNPMIRTFLKAQRSGNRLTMVHYPSGQAEFIIPTKEPTMGASAPYWNVGGTVRFKDVSGEKWESVGGIKILHYTHRTPTPIGTEQAIAMDQLNEMLAQVGLSTRGFIGDVYYMISESAKGPEAENIAWTKLSQQSSINRETRVKITEILDYIKSSPDIRYMLSKTAVFTYQTAVSVVDHITSYDVSGCSSSISFIRDQERRRRDNEPANMMKWATIAVMVIFAVSIGALVFLLGTGLVGGS